MFQILLDGNLTDVAYPTFARAAAVWRDAGRSGRVVQMDAEDRIVREFHAQECEEAAEIFLRPR